MTCWRVGGGLTCDFLILHATVDHTGEYPASRLGSPAGENFHAFNLELEKEVIDEHEQNDAEVNTL